MAARIEQARVKSAHQSLRDLIVKADWSDEAVLTTIRQRLQLTSSGMALSVSLVREASSAAPQHRSKAQIVRRFAVTLGHPSVQSRLCGQKFSKASP